MSLYVGHLSPHVHPEELERVFRRFGRCSFQLKDGYGFVVYEVTANAERALRALRGKQICGEQISLNWSNKQPRPFQKPRGSRFDEPYRRRVFREDDNAAGFQNSHDRRDFSTDVPLPAYNHGKRRADGVPDKEADHNHENSDIVRVNRGENLTDVLMDDDGTGELNSLDYDRWGEPTRNMLPTHVVGKGPEFDRYEPYHGYNKRVEKEGNQRGSSDSSPYRELRGRGHREHFIEEGDRKFEKSTYPLTCYNCGQAGHIKRKCPEGEGRRDRFTNFERMRDEMSFRDKVEGKLKKFRANSWGRPSTSKDLFVARRQTWDRKELRSYNDSYNDEKSPRTKSSPERREKHRSKLRSKSQTKKGSKRKYPSKKRAGRKRRARISDTSSTSSDSSKSSSTKSKSSSISDTRSHSTSSSASSKSGSASSRSKSISISSYAKSKSSKSRSRSISRQRSWSTPAGSLSLSISLGQKSSSSPKNKERRNSEDMKCPESKPRVDNSEVKQLEDESALSSLGVKKILNNDSGVAPKSDTEVGNNETYPCFDALNGAAFGSSDCKRETNVWQGALSMKHMKQPSNSTTISTGEMLSALRHYGLGSPKEGELDVTVEKHLGAGRLWPWELIYYRRLKRGPITTENYAKRLEQNKEFGIVDKYIRSSSGWGEGQKDP